MEIPEACSRASFGGLDPDDPFSDPGSGGSQGLALHGGVEADTAKEALESVVHRLRSCYTPRLHENPSLAGEATLAWQVDPGGAVRCSAVLQITPELADLEPCLRLQAQRASFGRELQEPGEVAILLQFEP